MKDVISSKDQQYKENDTSAIDEETESSEIQENTFYNPSASIECENCDFIAKNKKGLKIHRNSKHPIEIRERTYIHRNIWK